MAKPIKVVQRTELLSYEQIMSDIYMLSFMHIHSMLKTRLPISIHYADLSSTFYNRGLLHPRSQHDRALPFV
jgi:argonaute-like protein implicated in RNA metabolism and viral defense